METKRDRLEKYWRMKGYRNEKSFARALGLHQDHVGKIDIKGSSGKLTERLAEFCPDLNISWVITGEGEMLTGEREKAPPGDMRSLALKMIGELFDGEKTPEEQLDLASDLREFVKKRRKG